MDDAHQVPESADQRDLWEKFYREQKRPWRGVGKLEGLEIEHGARVLDIGCGNGKTSSALINMGASVIGLDFSSSAVEYCRSMFGAAAEFVVADCESMPFPDKSFDAVAAVHIFEHLNSDEAERTVSEIRRVLVPGGKVFIRVFAVGDLRAKGKDSDVKGNGISYRYYTEDQMSSLFSGFEVISSKRIDETARFGAVRVKLESAFKLPE
ncbi:MAG: class I SAM-dependent methyltransferase [Candidatus Methanoplasma sp.]|jgi:ubiquinone/menaquinone biosynthesis C-methylase UbiE|nr:class I SAM-dependent methyltransferase [Candidatus Methanoplasma sp.]